MVNFVFLYFLTVSGASLRGTLLVFIFIDTCSDNVKQVILDF